VYFGVGFGSFVGVMLSVRAMTMSNLGVVGCFLVIACLVMLRSFMVMLGGVLVVFGRFLVVFASFVCHRNPLENK